MGFTTLTFVPISAIKPLLPTDVIDHAWTYIVKVSYQRTEYTIVTAILVYFTNAALAKKSMHACLQLYNSV